MNLTIPKSKLISYLTMTELVANSRSTVPILTNVLIEAQNELFSITASNLETGIQIIDSVPIEREGALAVNVRKLLSVIRELPDDDVALSVDESSRLNIESCNKSIHAKFVILGLQKENFPSVSTDLKEGYFEVDANKFKSMIKKVIFSISQDENQYAITGVFFELYEGEIRLVATDGKRLSLIREESKTMGIPDNTELIPQEGAIIPKTALNEILRATIEGNKISIAFSKNQIFFRYNNVHLVSNLIEGKFPDYKRIIPTSREKYFTALRPLLYEAVKRVSVLVDENYRQIKLSILPEKLIVSTKNPTLGGAAEEIPIQYSGEAIDIALNYQYLLDCLKEIDSESVVIDFEDSDRAITIKGMGNNYYVNIIMPMKINV